MNKLIIEMDNNIESLEYYTNHLSLKSPFYFKQNIYSYWISSSHNTYLPYGQVFDPSSECYYKLILSIYFGGCVEIDTDSVSVNRDDIVITHLPTNTKSVSLREIFKVVMSAIKTKEQRGIVSGPIILTFDNKKLNKPWQHDVFWKVLESELLNEENYKYVATITDEFDLRKIPIDTLSNKILLRWAENENVNCKDPQGKVGKDLCPPNFSSDHNYSKTKKHWVHLLKGHSNFGKSIAIDNEEFLNEGTQNILYRKPNPNFGKLINNETKSVSVPITFKYTKSNYNFVINLQRNIMRMFPHFSYTMSQNYSNMTYFRDGVQITALNLQYISDSWYLNRAVFLPKLGVPCSPHEMKTKKECTLSWKNGNEENPLAYRLKPLWLLGLIPNPGYYKLNIKVIKCSRITVDSSNNIKLEDVSSDYKKINLLYGLTDIDQNSSINTDIVFDRVDVTVPFFVLEVTKPARIGKSSVYKTGIEIPWSINMSDTEETKRKNHLTVDAYKIVKTMLGSLNKVDLSDSCEKSLLFNTHKQIRVELEYSWTFHSEIEEMAEYNKSVRELREKYDKPISYFLEKNEKLTNYQLELATNLLSKPSNVAIEEVIDEDTIAEGYDANMEKNKASAKKVNDSESSED